MKTLSVVLAALPMPLVLVVFLLFQFRNKWKWNVYQLIHYIYTVCFAIYVIRLFRIHDDLLSIAVSLLGLIVFGYSAYQFWVMSRIVNKD